MPRLDLFLNVPKDQRIHPLAIAIWQCGVRPMSWAMQCGPDFMRVVMDEDALRLVVAQFIDKLEADAALREAVEHAEAQFNKQGRSLFVDENGNRVDQPNISEDPR